jgi:hypothetical protein
VSYPPPSSQGQPQYEYGPSGYLPPPQPDATAAEHHRRRRKNRITAGAILGTAASIATILTLFITLDQQPQQNNIPNNDGHNTPATAYPVNVQSNFLNSCETNGPQNVCQCSLNWFEQHVSLSQFEQDETDIEQGASPVDITNVEQACG